MRFAITGMTMARTGAIAREWLLFSDRNAYLLFKNKNSFIGGHLEAKSR